MPLLDHFRPPLSERRPWESLHAAWAGALADALNDHILPSGFVALEQIHAGAVVEIDVATFAEPGGRPAPERNGGTATTTRAVWLPAAPPLVIPAVFPPSCTIQILATDGGRTLVGAIELVSPGNKDRAVKRSLFAAKCATYLARGVGLVVVDVVTSRQGNMHNEVADLLGWESAHRMAAEISLYTVAYRPLRRDGAEQIETWPMPLVVGAPLPVVPLSLEAEHCLAVDLEEAYSEACRRRRVDEAMG
jgi:hypothetical protein